MTRKYKYVISLQGERYFVCYDETENNITTEVIKDIDTTPGDVEEGLRQEYVVLLHEALDNTDSLLNHTKTIEYIKNDYISQLDKLYDTYFEHQTFNIDGYKFNVSNRSLHYYRQITGDIEANKSKLEILNFTTKQVLWGDQLISFESFLEYMNNMILYIEKLNKKFHNDKKWIANINPAIDFSNYIDIEAEMVMFREISDLKNQDRAELIISIKKEIFPEFNEKTDDAWQTIINLVNPENVDILKELSISGQEVVQKYIALHQIYLDKFTATQSLINNKTPNYVKTQKKLDDIIARWSI